MEELRRWRQEDQNSWSSFLPREFEASLVYRVPDQVGIHKKTSSPQNKTKTNRKERRRRRSRRRRRTC